MIKLKALKISVIQPISAVFFVPLRQMVETLTFYLWVSLIEGLKQKSCKNSTNLLALLIFFQMDYENLNITCY